MFVDFLLQRFAEFADREAMVWQGSSFSYDWLLERLEHWRERADAAHIEDGSVVAVEADFSPDAVALFLALARHGCIVVPLTGMVDAKRREFLRVGEVEQVLRLGDDQDTQETEGFRSTGTQATHPHYGRLRELGHPGLVIFSSGSTGDAKGAVHDLAALLEKFHTRRPARRMISFLLYDHIGGVNTMLHTLSNGGCLVAGVQRTPRAVLEAVAAHQVEVLPVTPSFLNLILLSDADEGLDLSSLEVISYGTEPMPQSTLQQVHQRFPHLKLQQMYGLSEVGILRSKSKESTSLWMKIGGEGISTRVRDGLLEIQAPSAMLGYLNAPSPFTEDGWLQTGDEVEVNGEYFRVLGRRSEMINVGGQKVYPAEVENVIRTVENVADVLVYGESNIILGQAVCARVQPRQPEDKRQLKKRIQKVCRQQLQAFMVPSKVIVDGADQMGGRLKKDRNLQHLPPAEPPKGDLPS